MSFLFLIINIDHILIMNKTITQIRKKLIYIRKNIVNKECFSFLLKNKICLLNLKNKNVGSYISTKEEISPIYINEELVINNNIIYYPILHPVFDNKLLFCKDDNKYHLNKYNILEPIFNINNIYAPWELDIIIVPLVGFNNKKERIGMGKGFYDRTLINSKLFNKNIKFIGIGFDNQYHEFIANTWDISMNIIITPSKIIF